jgi:hypothetical protein
MVDYRMTPRKKINREKRILICGVGAASRTLKATTPYSSQVILSALIEGQPYKKKSFVIEVTSTLTYNLSPKALFSG